MLTKFKAWVLNRDAAKPQSRAKQIIAALDIHAGAHIVDIGAGGGYFSYQFSKATGNTGIVFAVETNAALLALIGHTCHDLGIQNVRTVHVQPGGVPLLHTNLDIIFLRDVYHHLKNPVPYFKALRQSLKSKSKLVIIDYKPQGIHRIIGHCTAAEKIVEEVTLAGFFLEKQLGILPKQCFLKFSASRVKSKV